MVIRAAFFLLLAWIIVTCIAFYEDLTSPAPELTPSGTAVTILVYAAISAGLRVWAVRQDRRKQAQNRADKMSSTAKSPPSEWRLWTWGTFFGLTLLLIGTLAGIPILTSGGTLLLFGGVIGIVVTGARRARGRRHPHPISPPPQ